MQPVPQEAKKPLLTPEWIWANLRSSKTSCASSRRPRQKNCCWPRSTSATRGKGDPSPKLQDHLADRTPTPWAAGDRIRLTRGLIAGLANALPALNADNLHEFRKRAKTARYLADVSAKSDPYAARQAALLKEMQNAAGQWHDQQTLASKALDALGTGNALVKMLEQQAEKSLQNTLKMCPRVMAQLLDQSARNGVSKEATPHKKPVQRVEIIALKGDRRYA